MPLSNFADSLWEFNVYLVVSSREKVKSFKIVVGSAHLYKYLVIQFVILKTGICSFFLKDVCMHVFLKNLFISFVCYLRNSFLLVVLHSNLKLILLKAFTHHRMNMTSSMVSYTKFVLNVKVLVFQVIINCWDFFVLL